MIGTGIGLGLSGYRMPVLEFSPTNLNGLQVWLDGSDSSTMLQSSGGSPVASNGDPIGVWRDKSGNSYHATQTDGTKKPTFRTNVKNGKSVVRFDGTNDHLQLVGSTSFLKFLHNSNSTVFVAAKNSGAGNSMLLCSNNGTGSNTGFWFYYPGTTSFWPIATNGTTANVVYSLESSITNTNYNLMMAYTKAGDPTASERVKNYNNGSLLSGANTLTNAADSGNSGFDVFVGSGSSVSNYPLNGDILEILIYNQVLSTGDRQKIETYLNSKWSIY